MFVLPAVAHTTSYHDTAVIQEKPCVSLPVRGTRPARRRMEEYVDLPTGEQLRKPLKSYANLISEAILSSPIQKMTLADIYRYIMDNYPYYRHAGTGWQVYQSTRIESFYFYLEFCSSQPFFEQGLSQVGTIRQGKGNVLGIGNGPVGFCNL